MQDHPPAPRLAAFVAAVVALTGFPLGALFIFLLSDIGQFGTPVRTHGFNGLVAAVMLGAATAGAVCLLASRRRSAHAFRAYLAMTGIVATGLLATLVYRRWLAVHADWELGELAPGLTHALVLVATASHTALSGAGLLAWLWRRGAVR